MYCMWPARLLCPWDFPGKNTGVGCHFLLQGIFLTQGSNLHLWHWQVDYLLLSHQGDLGAFSSSTSSSIFVICRLFDDTHSDRGEVITHCNIDLHFSDIYQWWASFHVPVDLLYILFGKISIQVFCALYNWVVLILSCMSCLCVLDINLLLIMQFANIFYWSIGCLFILLMVSFSMESLLRLIRYHLLVFAFVSFALGDIFKKILLWFMSKSVLPMILSRVYSLQPYI